MAITFSTTRLTSLLRPGLIALLVILVSGCGLLSDSDDNNDNNNGSTGSNGASSSVRVLEAVFSTRITADQQATGIISNVFPHGVTAMHAVIVLEGVEDETEIVGRWYQLNVSNAPPDGREITRSSITLSGDQVVQGTARVALNLDGSGRFLPPGAWLLRVYDGDTLLRTMAFYVLADPATATPTAVP